MNAPTPESANRRPEFVTLIAVYQFITAAILFLLSCLIPVLVFPSIFVYIDRSDEIFLAIGVATGALALTVGFGLASIVVGYGLLRMRNWGRLGAIVLAAFALIGFPIWTVVAVLVLVYLTSTEAREAFTRTRTRAAGGSESGTAQPNRAVYKAEPAPPARTDLLGETRPMKPQHASTITPEGPAPIPPDDETHRIEPIPMPPSDETIEMTEQVEPVSPEDATIEIPLAEPAEDQPTTEVPAIPAEDPPTSPKRRWVRPPEEAAMDDRILRPREEDSDSGNRDG
jgi:hypothetical protein